MARPVIYNDEERKERIKADKLRWYYKNRDTINAKLREKHKIKKEQEKPKTQ